jgi:endoglucanase
MRPFALVLVAMLLASATVGVGGSRAAPPFPLTPAPEIAGLTAMAEARALGRGANLGGVLDAPNEGDWGQRLTPALFSAAKTAGLQTIRLPVRFSNHAAAASPYALDEAFLQRVDFAVRQALANGLLLVIDYHHDTQLEGEPADPADRPVKLSDDEARARFLAIWTQVSERYQSLPNDKVLFELYNEPHGKLTDPVYNPLVGKALAIIRKTNPYRFVVVDPINWSDPNALPGLELPDSDQRLIADFHNYQPFAFTSQGADWIAGSDKWLGTTCCGMAQQQDMIAPFEAALVWQRSTGRPVWLGEFGSQDKAALADRVTFSRMMRNAAESRGIPWAYWDFGSGEYGFWNAATGTFNTALEDALLGK